eukprot:3283151-Prymnesium_polylepis.1
MSARQQREHSPSTQRPCNGAIGGGAGVAFRHTREDPSFPEAEHILGGLTPVDGLSDEPVTLR